MGEQTKIQWTDATLNFWWGCTKVSDGCDGCYAEAWAKRSGEDIWGPGKPRRLIKSAGKTARKLAQQSLTQQDEGKGPIKVFVQSMSDIFDNEVDPSMNREALLLCEELTPLRFQILTKRVSNVAKMVPAHWRHGEWPKHIGLMITVVNQQEADRDIPRLLQLKADFGIPWVGLSMEPLLDKVVYDFEGIDWVIVGGESGHNARPMLPGWVMSIRKQCEASGTAFFFKQWGEWAWAPLGMGNYDAEEWGINRFGNLRDIKFMAPGLVCMKVGKAAAGRHLEGKLYDTFPRSLLP